MAEAYLALDLTVLEHRHLMVRRRQIARNRRSLQNPLGLEETEFLMLYRISKEMFYELVEELRASLKRRRPYGLSTERQILTALRFYATGCYQQPIGMQWGNCMSQKSVSRVIRQVTLAINQNLLRKYVKFPNSFSERQLAKQKFMSVPQPFPNAIGAIDCTHIKILAPRVHEEAYVSGHHEGHSLNVQVVCDPDLLILNVNARWPGARHDAHIWANSPVRSAMKSCYDGGDHQAWLLGDDGYPLEPWLMTPIKHQPFNSPTYKYTEAHCAARNVVERCFGVLKSTFRCLSRQRQLMYEPNIAGQIVNACVVLHNKRMLYKLNDVISEEIDTNQNVGDIHDQDAEFSGRAVAERIRRRLIDRFFT